MGAAGSKAVRSADRQLAPGADRAGRMLKAEYAIT